MTRLAAFMVGVAIGSEIALDLNEEPPPAEAKPPERCFYAEYQSVEEMNYRLDQPRTFVKMNGKRPEVYIPAKNGVCDDTAQ